MSEGSPPDPATEASSDSDPEAAACPNCGSVRIARYCAECGQALPGPADYSLRAHAAELVAQVTSTDGKALRTLGTLAARPGRLTVDHLQGRRARYLSPLQLFLLANVLLFIAAPQVPLFSYSLEKYLRYAPPSPELVQTLVQRATPRGHTHVAGQGGEEFEAFARSFDARVEAQRKSLVILLAPALAGILWGMFRRRRPDRGVPRRFGEHLVFALHLLSFLWLVLAGVGILGAAASVFLSSGRGPVMIAGMLILQMLVPVYGFLALRNVYRTGWPLALAATALVAVSFVGLLVAYRGLLFFTTYYTM